MKVIGAGFGRTGTMSQKAALEQLGFGPSRLLASGKCQESELTAPKSASGVLPPQPFSLPLKELLR